MGKKVREYKSGDFIFAKVKGYPAWPARVQKQNGKKYFVYFYGTGETANLPPNMIFDYSENKDKFLNKSVKRKDFNDGVKQIEHDFANNVPLEQVIGALAAIEPAPADDTLNDSGMNDTINDSAIADTTADDSIDENAANSTVSDAPVEDSDDAGALVIDEGKQKGRKSAAKPATPKPKEPKTPRGRPKKEESKEADEEEKKKEEEIVSRSGRKIRPKRYIDEQTEENTTLPSPAPKKRRGASPAVEKEKPEAKEKPQDKNIRAYNTVQQSELRELKEPFKSADAEKENILITYLPSGEYCGVKLFTGRPSSFKNEAARLQWDKQAASNAITLKRQLEKGQITPESISAQLVMDLNLTDEEKSTLDKDRDLELKKSRLHFLKTEMKLIELDAKIKTCISLEKADTELCLKLIDEILELDLAALMLLKHPTCMETVKRMRVYVGNTPSWEMSESEALNFSKQAHHIRNKADALFITMRDLFDVPEGLSFWEYFHQRVAQFKAITENLHADKLLEMVHEPIELSQPASHTMKAAIDAANANEDEPMEEDTAQKKKTTPAKGKKANSTPLKTPLKRQSSRKQQEDKEKEKEQEKERESELDGIPEKPETKKANDTEKTDSTEKNDAPKENNDESVKADDAEKANENDIDEDKEIEKVNESSEKKDEEKTETVETEDKGAGDSEKANEADNSPKETESNSNAKGDKAEKSNDSLEKDGEKESEDKVEKSAKDSKKAKESDKNSNSDKNSKSKDKKDEKPKEDVKNSKDKTKAGDKRKDKKEEKEKSEEKEKVDVDEPRAKRSRESKKTEPPPRSPAKRKSKF